MMHDVLSQTNKLQTNYKSLHKSSVHNKRKEGECLSLCTNALHKVHAIKYHFVFYT